MDVYVFGFDRFLKYQVMNPIDQVMKFSSRLVNYWSVRSQAELLADVVRDDYPAQKLDVGMGSVERAARQVLKNEYTNLAEIEKVLANPINGDVFVNDDLNDDLFGEEVRSDFVTEYLQSKFDPELIKGRIDAFTSFSKEKIQSFHRFLAHHIFCPKNLARMNEEAAAYVATLTPFSREDLGHYSEWGAVRLLRNQNGLELTDAMRGEGFSDREILSVINFAINANAQIGLWIDLTYTMCDKDTLATIRKELLEADGPLWIAASQNKKLCDIVKEGLRFTTGGDLRRVTPNREVIYFRISDLGKDPELVGENPEQFNPNRFAMYNSEHLPRLKYLPFGTGPNQCPGWRLAHTQVLQGLAHLVLGNGSLIDP
ncbi:MAG: cytochrome P450 [Chlamydiales bacterium]|nr:cytochrome P450 [Chlamydiales bacterium]